MLSANVPGGWPNLIVHMETLCRNTAIMRSFLKILARRGSGVAGYFLAGLFLALLSASVLWASDPDIVIINSYHYGQEWSHAELEGLMKVLQKQYPKRLPSVEYLDTNRFGDEKSLRKMASFLIGKYAGKKPDLVIALDNPALALLLANRAKLFPGAPIVFAGINDYSPSMLEGQGKITGIAEVTDNRGSLEIILKINPETKRILILNDHTITGKALHNDLEPFLGLFGDKVDILFYYPGSFEEAREGINGLPEGTAVLIASFVADSGGKALTTAESTQLLTSGNMVPVYAMRESRLGYGILGGMLLSGTEHGQRAGYLALRVLAGEDPSSIPVDISAHAITMFDYKAMRRLGVSQDHLPPGSIVINRTSSFFEEHKMPILFALTIIGILSIAVLVLLFNIMKRRQAEKELSELSQYTSALFEEARDALFVADAGTGVILGANRAAEKLMQRPKSELIGMHQSKLHPSGSLEKCSIAFRQHTAGNGQTVEVAILAADGSKTPVEINASIIDSTGGKRILMGAFRDVSERNRLQDQLLHAQKMEAIGTLAGGVAHEFNNVLTAIMGSAEMLRMAQGQQSRLDHLIEIILKASGRASRLTQSLLSFCRKQVTAPQHADINALILNQEKLFAKLIGEDIVIEKELSETPCVVLADPGQIEQIVMNIVLNARDAMPNGGVFEIRTEIVKGVEIPEQTPDDLKAADYVLMSFKDTGCGMDAAIKDKIFEPFFTTKEVGKGTGLGLSIVYGIVMQSNGFIDVRSEAGKGTEFRIFLPYSTATIRQAETERHADLYAGGAGNILFAEDDEMLMQMQTMFLRNAGYRVFEAADGNQAIKLFREHSNEIEVVVLDVVMPVINGKETYEAIKKLRPDVKVLLISGYADDVITTKGIKQDKMNFLAKPFTPHQLLKKIREIINNNQCGQESG
jgi:two-component system, cell cycle sensor histidine kinase and response regulator CckA